MVRKYGRIFVLGHYLFLVAHSFLRAKLEENCSLLRTDSVRGQTSEHIFAPNGDYCLYRLVCKNAVALGYCGSCRLLVMVSWRFTRVLLPRQDWFGTPTWATFHCLETGFVPCFGLKIQGLFKDLQRHIFHFSRTPRTAKSKDNQFLIEAIVPS